MPVNHEAQSRPRRATRRLAIIVACLGAVGLGVGYFIHHWAYGLFTYQRRHARLWEVYSASAQEHEALLHYRLKYSASPKPPKLSPTQSGKNPEWVFDSDWDPAQVAAMDRRRVESLGSEESWQNWLAGPWRQRPQLFFQGRQQKPRSINARL